MDSTSALLAAKAMLLLMVANGLPILLNVWLRDRAALPIDGGIRLGRDGQPLFGSHKTWRGLVAAIMGTAAAAVVLGLPAITGAWVGLWAMAGDVLSSFLKRRLARDSGDQALGLDQIPESLLPLLAVRSELGFGLGEVAALVALFLVLELLLSRVLFAWNIREHPW
jgi:CDP-2,3-bis-(O-geranylgeranyl)-sn-glycerol synthase